MEIVGIFGSIVVGLILTICIIVFLFSYNLPFNQWHCTQYDSQADYCVVYTHIKLLKQPTA